MVERISAELDSSRDWSLHWGIEEVLVEVFPVGRYESLVDDVLTPALKDLIQQGFEIKSLCAVAEGDKPKGTTDRFVVLVSRSQ